MPKIVRRPRRDPVIEARLAEWKEFEEPTAWQRSKKGNCWRRWSGETLTIFKRPGKRFFTWCIAADDDDKQYSSDEFESEADAMSTLGFEVGVGL